MFKNYSVLILMLCLFAFSNLVLAQDASLPQTVGEDVAVEAVETTDAKEEIENPKMPSLSDFAVEELTKVGSASGRNPFAPGLVQEEFDPTALIIEGIVVGPRAEMAMISGQVVKTGDRVGNYSVKEIRPGKVILSQLEEDYIVRMANYSPHLEVRSPGKYFIDFYNADIRKVLYTLAKISSMNLIVPENLAGRVTVSFMNTDVQNAIASILRVNDLEYATENGIMRVGKAEQFKDGSDLKVYTASLRYATAEKVSEKLKTFLSERGSSTFDSRTNTVIIKDHANVIDNARRFLASIDKKDPQVSIEAKIIDASRSFSRSLGIQWGFTSGPNNLILRGNQDVGTITGSPHSGSVANFPANNPTSGLDLLVGRLPWNTSLQSQLSAAESNGSIRIISKPNVTTLNNQKATIQSGLTLYVKTDSGTDQGAQVQAIETGITLDVTPQITLNRMVKLTLSAVESEADFSRTVDGIPAIINNTVTSTVLVPDGETAVIGGLLKVRSTKEKRGVPGLSKVPVLGWLFKSTTRTKDDNELMIFITPKIIDSPDKIISAYDEPSTMK